MVVIQFRTQYLQRAPMHWNSYAVAAGNSAAYGPRPKMICLLPDAPQ